MEILQVLFEESEIILSMIIVIFLMKKLQNLSARSTTQVKCGKFTFELLSIEFLVNLKKSFPHFVQHTSHQLIYSVDCVAVLLRSINQ